jgi:hypothetical protein
MKKSTSLGIRKLKLKTTLRFHFTPVRMTLTKEKFNSKFWRGCVERGTEKLLVGF